MPSSQHRCTSIIISRANTSIMRMTRGVLRRGIARCMARLATEQTTMPWTVPTTRERSLLLAMHFARCR